MTTTPHPADALPLPEPDEVACVGGVAQNIWCEPKIRAARREGFELAMSKSKAEIASLRFMLAVRVAGSALYGDDGELQDNSTYPQIDFKRDSVEEIESKLIERGTRRFVQDMNALASQPAQQRAGAVVSDAPKYRLLQRNVDVIEATDEFLAEDAETWAIDPNGIFVGNTYGGMVLRPARRAVLALTHGKAHPHD